MKRIRVDKVVINIGVGRSGEPIDKARNALLELTGQQPAVRGAKKTVRDFGIHKGEPVGVVVTLRREPAIDFLKRIVAAKRNILKYSSFDAYGNISVGIHEHIRSEEHTSELQSRQYLVCRLLLEKKKNILSQLH